MLATNRTHFEQHQTAEAVRDEYDRPVGAFLQGNALLVVSDLSLFEAMFTYFSRIYEGVYEPGTDLHDPGADLLFAKPGGHVPVPHDSSVR